MTSKEISDIIDIRAGVKKKKVEIDKGAEEVIQKRLKEKFNV